MDVNAFVVASKPMVPHCASFWNFELAGPIGGALAGARHNVAKCDATVKRSHFQDEVSLCLEMLQVELGATAMVYGQGMNAASGEFFIELVALDAFDAGVFQQL